MCSTCWGTKMSKKFEYPVSNWCFDKLEQRILLSGEAMVEPVDQASEADSSAEGAGEILTVNENTVEQVAGIKDYQPEVDGALVDLQNDNVLPDQPASSANILPEHLGLTDIHLTPDEALEASGGLVVDDTEILTGTGEVHGSVVNEGTVSPGNSPGVQSVDDYTQTADGTLIMEVAGTGAAGEADGFDQIVVAGDAEFNGVLDVRMLGDFTPTAGQVYDIIAYSSRTGEFAEYKGLELGNGLCLKPMYLADRLQLEVVKTPGGMEPEFSDSNELVKYLNVIAGEAGVDPVTVNGSFNMAGQKLSGQFTFSLADDDSGYEVIASNLSAEIKGGEASVSLLNASGVLFVTSDGVAGSLTGDVGISGLQGVFLAGPATFAFNTTSQDIDHTFDNGVTLTLASDTKTTVSGDMQLAVDNLAAMQGSFVIEQLIDGDNSTLHISGSNIAADIGTGAKLSDGWIAMIVADTETGMAGYALHGSATAALTPATASLSVANGVAFSSTATLKANTLRRTVNESWEVAGSVRNIAFDTADQLHILDVADMDMKLNPLLANKLDEVAQTINSLKDKLVASVDADGNVINPGIMAETIPGTDATLESLLGMTDLFGVGDYIRAYLTTSTGVVLEGDAAALPAGDYSATGEMPSLQGLHAYLMANWEPAKTGGLVLSLVENGFKVGFNKTIVTHKDVQIDFGERVSRSGLTLDDNLTVDVEVANKVDFGVVVDWGFTDASFEFGNMDYEIRAGVDNLTLDASYGALAVTLGNGSKGVSLDLNLTGRLGFDNSNNITNAVISDEITAILPVFATVGEKELGGNEPGTIIVEGSPLTSDEDFSYRVENFDSFSGFTTFTVGDLIRMFPEFMDMLGDMRESDAFATEIPFVEGTLEQLFDFADGFNKEVYSKIDFSRQLEPLLDGLAGTVTADSRELTLSGITLTDKQASDLVNKYVEFADGVVRNISAINTETGVITFDRAFDADASLSGLSITEKKEQIKTVQEFTDAINNAGITPAGLTIEFDLETGKFTIPIAFSHTFAPVEKDLVLDVDLGEVSNLTTTAKAGIEATVGGGLKIFFDLGENTVSGNDGVVAEGKKTFTSDSANFDDSLVGYHLEIDGYTFKVLSVTNSTTLELDKAATVAVSGAAYVLNEAARIGVEDVSISADMSLIVDDPEVAARIGYLGVTAGGSGSGSQIKVTSSATGSLVKDSGITQFTTDEISNGSFMDSFVLDLTGEAQAVLKKLQVDPGVGQDLTISDTAEIAVYVQDFIAPENTVKVGQPVTEGFDLDALVAGGGATQKDTVLVTPELGDAFAFKDATFLDIIRALRMGIDFIEQGVGESAFFNANVPLLNTSLADILNLTDDFLAVLERVGEDPAGTIQGVESKIEKALGITDDNTADTYDQAFALYLDGSGGLGIHLDYKQFFSELFTFNLDLKTLQDLAGGQMAALAGLDMLSDKQGRGAAANIVFEGFFDLQLDAGIRFPDEGEPEIFLYDSDPEATDAKRGTKATLGYRVEGRDLNMAFDSGPLSLGVEGGTAVIDADGIIDTKDYATLVVHLDQIATEELGDALSEEELARIPDEDDGRFMFDVYKDGVNVDAENIKHNLKAEATGKLFVDLPVRLDFNGVGNNFNQHLTVTMAPDKYLGDLMDALVASEGTSVETVLQIQAPDIVQKFEALGGSYGLMSILNDPDMIIDGIDDSLAMIQDVFLDGFGVKLPLIGDVLGEFSGFINDIRIDLLADLRKDLSMEGGLIRLVQQSYYDVFSTELHLLQDSDNDGDVDIDDVMVGWYDLDNVKLGDWALDGEVPVDVDSVQFDMKLGGKIVGGDVDIPLDIDLPGFGLEVDGGFVFDMDWSLDFGTGISGTEGFYMVAQDSDDPEFEVDVELLLDSDVSTDAIDPFTGVGKLAFFKATLTDKDHDTNAAGFQGSGIKGSYQMDFVGDDRGRMTMNYLNSTPMDKAFVDEFIVDTDIHMGIVLEVDDDTVPMPKLVADLVIDWDYSSISGMGDANIGLTRFGIDVDSLVKDFLLPITEQVRDILSPLDPVIDSLYTTVPGLDKIGVNNVMDLIDTCMMMEGKGAVNWGFVHAAKSMMDMPDTVRSWADEGGIIYLGDITGFGTGDISAQKNQSEEALQALAKLEAQEAEVDRTGNGGADGESARSGFRYLEYVTDLSNWMKILTGGDATLFTYEMPIMEQAARVDVPIYGVKMGPAKFGVFATGNVSLAADMAFGYDTSGLRKSMKSGNPLDAFDGFYVSNVTMPEFANGSIVPGTGGLPKPEVMFDVSVGLEAGVNAGPVAGGLSGAIIFDADLNLKDIEKSVLTKDEQGYVTNVAYEDDGKVRMSEILTMCGYNGNGPLNLFNIESETRVQSDVYVDVNIPIVGKKRIIDETLFKVVLYEKDYMAPTVMPTLGVVDGGVLTINAGTLAANREYFNTKDFGESFWLYGDSSEVAIEFDGWYQTFGNVDKVVIDLGEGDDMLDASRLSDVFVDVRGGDGDDTILLGDGGGHVRGEDGDDVITVLSGSTGTILDGGAGSDRLTGAAGDDVLIGGSGNDKLYGNAGADTLEGGSGADNLSGGAGDDTYVFNNNYGSDRFSDTQGATSLDFSGVTAGLDMSVGRRGVSVVNTDGDELRINSGKVVSIALSSGDDNVRFGSFVDWEMNITDNGGNDDYRFTMGRAQAQGATGTYNITDTSGDFDEVIVTQTRLGEALFINSGQVENGREIINYDGGIERLTLAGKGARFDADEVRSFGGDVFFDTKSADNISDLGSTDFRVVANEVRMDSAVQAAHVILDSMESINIDERLIATSDGYVDIRTYGDDADILLNADVIVSSGTDATGDGSGWIRMISADGSILRGAGTAADDTAQILAAGSYLQLKAHNAIGSKSSEILTQVKELSAVTNTRGEGDIVLTEADDLNLIVERSLGGVQNAGFRFDTAHGDDYWESKVDWDDTVSADWSTLLQHGRTDYAVEAGNGDLVLTQTGQDALLTLESGTIHNKKSDGDITLTVDDIDFVSGAEKVIGTGDLTIQANQLAWKYLFGSAAETKLTGTELVRDHASNVRTMSMGMRDFAALADGFNKTTIGRSNDGNTMVIGDLLNATSVKYNTSVARNDQASLRDHTVFVSDDMEIAGEVRADGNTLELHATTLSVGSQNYHDQDGEPDSGVRGESVIVDVTDQLHVGGWIIGEDLVDIDVTASSGTHPTSTGAYVTPPNGIHSVFMDIGSRIESLNEDSSITIDTSHAMQAAGTIEAKGNASGIDMNISTDFLLKEGGRLISKGTDSHIAVNAGGVLALNGGTATYAGVEFAEDGITPVLTGAGADVSLTSVNEMLIAGSLTVSDGLTVSSGASVHDNAAYGDPEDAANYAAHYSIYNKRAYFDMLRDDHYLKNHTSGYGLMVTGTVTSLGENQKVVLGSSEDFILRGNVHITGANSDLTLHSNSFTYVEGFVDTTDDLTVLGGIATDGTDLGGSDQNTTSAYLHETTRVRTTGNDADIMVKGAKDVDIYGVLLAGGSIGSAGTIWSGKGADISVSAGEQVLLDSGLIAAGNISVQGGTPAADDGKLGLLVTTAGGMTAMGYQQEGGNISITSSANMEMMGTIVAGGSLVQQFDDDGNLISQTVNWSGASGGVDIDAEGQAFIGGNAVTKAGVSTTTGGYIHSAGDVTIEGGMNDSGMGVRVHGASEIAVKKADGNISITSAGDAEVLGLLAAGGQINQVRDASGKYQGRTIDTFDGASSIRIEAEKQIRVGVGLKAGQSIDLIGGDGSGDTDSTYADRGIVLQGSAQLTTWKENSTINLNSPGRIDVLAPADTNEIIAEAWPLAADGKLPHDVTLDLVLDKISYDISAQVTIKAADTADNTKINDLMADIEAALYGAEWTITRSDVPEFVEGELYTGVANDPDTVQDDPDIKVKLLDGRLKLAGPYSITMKTSSVNADLLGFDTASEELVSGLYYAIDARKAGSVVNLGTAEGDNSKIYVAGKVIADKAINIYSGVSPDGVDIDIDASGVLETVNGSIEFNAGKNGVLWGDVIAGGEGSDIILNSDSSLTIRGELKAHDDVIIRGGAASEGQESAPVNPEGHESLRIEGTAKIISTGGGGELHISGERDVVINGVVGTGSNSLGAVSIASDHGTVTVLKESGWITADTGLTITGKDIDIQGVIESTAANTDGAEVDITAQHDLTVQADINVDADLALHAGNNVDIFNANIAVNNADSTLTVTSDNNITSSRGTIASGHESVPDGEYYYQGATVQGTGIITFNAANDLTIGNAVLLGTSEADSKIVLEGSTVTVIGSAVAGATVASGAPEWTGANSTLEINASERVNVGGEILDSRLTATQQGGSLKSSGDLTINVAGGSNTVSVSQNAKSNIIADSMEDADASSSHVRINTDHGIVLEGLVQANDAAGTVQITSGDQARFNGVVEAGSNITVTAGGDLSGTSIFAEDHVYKRDDAGKYFIDSNGRRMDGMGNLVDADGKYVDEAGVLLAADAEPVKGGDPVRLSGATFDVAAGGTIDFAAVNDIYLGGQVGRPVPVDGSVSANPVEINISSSEGSSNITGLVNALNAVNVTGNDASVLAGGVVRTRSDIGEVFFNVSGNIFVAGDDGAKGAGMVTASERVHFFGDNVRLDGNISATADEESLILANGVASVVVGGKLVSQGNVELRGGVGADWTEEQLTAASVDVSSLGDAYVQVVGAGSVHSEGNINVVSGGDFGIESEAVLGDGQKAIKTPVIVNKANTVQVVTGYNQVADGFISVPEVKWITTTVTEQSGTEEFKSGVSFNTMDVTLTQVGYYNAETGVTRKFFIEGNNGDYQNSAITWSGTTNPQKDSGYYGFNVLNDTQKSAVLNALGFKPLYILTSSNHQTHTVVNGNATKDTWTPEWWANEQKMRTAIDNAKSNGTDVDWSKVDGNEVVNIKVANWDDKFIRMATGAAEDVLSVVSQGDVSTKSEVVGHSYEKAKVEYTQVTSDHQGKTYYLEEPWESDGNGSIKVTVSDYDKTSAVNPNGVTDASWNVSYVKDTGSMVYVINDGHTGSRVDLPDWIDEDVETTLTGHSGGNLSGLQTTAASVYFTDTGTLTNIETANTRFVDVGVDKAGDGYTARKYECGTGDIDGQVIINSKAEFDHLASLMKEKYGLSGEDPILLKIGAYKKDGSKWWNDSLIPSGYGDVSTEDEPQIFFASFDGKSYELHDADRTSDKWIKEHAPKLIAKTITEEFNDYTYDWTSKTDEVRDNRLTMHYKYTSQATDKYEDRPTTRTYETTSKNVLDKQITVWRNEAVYGEQTVFTTERVMDEGKLVGWGKFDCNALEAKGDINVTTADDISVSGQVKGLADTSTVTLTAGGDVTVDGAAPSGGAGDEISAEALIESPAEIRIDAVGTVTFGDASTIRTTLDEADIIVNAGADAVLNGDMDVLDSIVVKANDDVNVGGHLKAVNHIDIIAGLDGTGGFTGSEASLLEVTATPAPVEQETVGGTTSESESSASAVLAEDSSDDSAVASDSTDVNSTVAGGDTTEGDGETPALLERKKGAVYLTAGKDSGDMLLTGASITSLGFIELTAEGGAITQTGGVIDTAELIGLSKNGFTANTSIDTLSVNNTGDGGLSIVNTKALNIADFDTTDGAISVTTFGPLMAGRLTTSGMGDDDDISIRVYGGGVTYNTIGVAEGGEGDISIKVQGAITNTGSESRMIGDEISIEVPGEIDIVTIANSLDLHSYEAGDITVRDISEDGVNIKNIVAGEGEVSVTAQGDVGVKNVLVRSERRDFSLTSGGRVFGMDNGAQPMITADQLTISARTGIEGLTTRTNELLDVQTVSGDISFVNTEDASDSREDLTVTNVTTGDGNISVTTDGALIAYTAYAGGEDSKLTLQSTDSNVTVRDTGAQQGIWSGGVLELDAGALLDLEVGVDAKNDLILRSGERFSIPTTGAYNAENITLESDENILVEGDLVFGGGTLELISKRDVVFDGSISSSDGSPVEVLRVTATAENPQTTVMRDADLQFQMYEGDILGHPDGRYVQHKYDGKFAYKAYYVPANSSTGQVLTVLTANADGSGNIYDVNGNLLQDANVYAEGADPKHIRCTVLDKTFVDVTATITEEPAPVVAYKPTSNIDLDLGDSQFDTMELSAGGTVGSIDLDFNRDLTLTNGYIHASADIDISTTKKLIVGEGVIGGYNGDDPEFITLTSGGDLVVNDEMVVEDGERWIEGGMKPVDGTVTLQSGGTITSTTDAVVARGTKLVAVADGEVVLKTDVDKLEAVVNGNDRLDIVDKGGLRVESVSVLQGSVSIATESDLEVVDLAMGTNEFSNSVQLTSFNGDVYVDHINAQSKGQVVVNAKGALKELSPADAEADIIANMVLALTEATTTDVEIVAPVQVIGRSQDITLDINSDFYLFGDFGGSLDLRVHGTLYIADTSAANYTLTVDEVAQVEGAMVTTGVLELTAEGVGFVEDSSLEGDSVTINTGAEGLTMTDDAAITAGSNGMDITTTKDMVLGTLSAGSNINLKTTEGAILDGTEEEDANITTSSELLLTAKTGIGVEGGEDLDTAVAGVMGGSSESGGINIQDTANLSVGSLGLKALSGAVHLAADQIITLNGVAGSGDSTAELNAKHIRLNATGGVTADSTVNIVASAGTYEQDAAAQVSSATDSVTIDANADATAANITAQGDVSITSRTGAFVQQADTSVVSNAGSVTVDTETAATVTSITAEEDVFVTSRSGTIFDNSAAGSAAITSLNGVVNLAAAVDTGEVGNALRVDGAVSAEAAGNIYLEGVNGLRTGEGGITSTGGNIELSSLGEVELGHDVVAEAGDVSLSGDSMQLKGKIVADSVTSVIEKITTMVAGSSITATDGSVELTSGSVVQAGNIVADASSNITVTSTDGSIEMVDESGTNVGGALITGDGTITYVSATDLKAGTFVTENDVYLTAQNGSIEDAFNDAPAEFGPQDFAKSRLNVAAKNLFADATGKIGDPEGNALDVNVKNLSAVSGEGTHIWARGDVQIVDPGLIVDGDGDLVLYTDGEYSFDPEATTDPLYGVTGEGAVTLRSGFVVPDSGSSALEKQRKDYLEMLQNQEAENARSAEQADDSWLNNSVLSEVFGEDAPQLILQNMFEESSVAAIADPFAQSDGSKATQNMMADTSLVEDIDEGRTLYRDSLMGDTSEEGTSAHHASMSLLGGLQSLNSESAVSRMSLFEDFRFGSAAVSNDFGLKNAPGRGERGLQIGAEPATTVKDMNIFESLQLDKEGSFDSRMSKDGGVLPIIEERNVDSLIQIPEGMSGVLGFPADNGSSSLEEDSITQSVQSIQVEKAVSPAGDSQ